MIRFELAPEEAVWLRLHLAALVGDAMARRLHTRLFTLSGHLSMTPHAYVSSEEWRPLGGIQGGQLRLCAICRQPREHDYHAEALG